MKNFNFGYLHLTLKEGSKVKSDHTRRFPAHDFLKVGLPSQTSRTNNITNLISKLNFYKLIPYPMDNCFTGRRDRSRQMPEKDVLYRILAEPVWRVHSPGGASYFLFLSRQRDVIASFSCLVLVRPLVS